MADAESATLLGEVVTSLGLLGSAIWAVFQYRQNNKDQQAERARTRALNAASEMETFHHDDSVQSAMGMIDYCEMPDYIMSDNAVPGAAPLFLSPGEFSAALRNHTDTMKSLVANPTSEKSELFTANERKIRDLIDGFLGRLERIDNLIARGVIDAGDFERLFGYWLQLMGEIPQPEDTLNHFDDPRRRALWCYIRTYRFDGVVRLFARYGRAESVAVGPDEAFKFRDR